MFPAPPPSLSVLILPWFFPTSRVFPIITSQSLPPALLLKFQFQLGSTCLPISSRRSSLDFSVFSNGNSLRFKPVRAAGEEGGSGEGREGTLQATIEKSKKVLAMQKDLLQQIAERRKLISDIKEGIVDPDAKEASYEQETASRYQDNATTTFESIIEQQNGSFNKDDYLPSVVDEEVLEAESSAIGGSYSDSGNELEHDLLLKIAVPDESFSRQLEYTCAEKTWSDELPAFLSSASESSTIVDEQSKGLTNGALSGINDGESEGEVPPPLAGPNVMNVILVAAECAPWSKTSGLGDVAGSLPKALAWRGHRVMVVAPRYGNYTEPQDTGVRKRYKVDDQDVEVTYFQALDFVFIDASMFHHIENNIYGGSRLDILKRMVPWHVPCGGVCYGDGNLVFIANDWHTALLPVYLKAYYRDHGIMQFTRSVLVIHNMAHQGRGPVNDFSYVNLPEHYIDLFRLYGPFGGEHFNIFAAGLKTADRVVTVSHGYAWELKTPEGGWGLHNIINENDWKLRGIVNGIDTREWNPRFEPCGLNQLYAMMYGTVPVVHAVGGLRDTVQPFDPFNDSGLGWTFDSAEANKLVKALGICLLTYREYKNSWEGLQRRGMTQYLSWDHAAEKYEEVLVAAKYQW